MLVRTADRKGDLAPWRYGMVAGEMHVVCAMFSLEPGVLLYCLDSERLLHVEAHFFDVADGRLSRSWRFAHEFTAGIAANCNAYYWGYPEFVASSDHRATLFNGERRAVDLYQNYLEQLTLEFALPFVREKARSIDVDWVLCARCDDAWQPLMNTNQMLRCPKCGTLQHRP